MIEVDVDQVLRDFGKCPNCKEEIESCLDSNTSKPVKFRNPPRADKPRMRVSRLCNYCGFNWYSSNKASCIEWMMMQIIRDTFARNPKNVPV